MAENKVAPSVTSRQYRYGAYIAGFLLSLALTLLAYWLVRAHVTSAHEQFSHRFAMGTICVLACTQLLVQLIFFLHLGRESRPFWNLQILIFAFGTVLIIVFGSLWIMNHLDYHHMTSPQQINQQIIRDEGVHTHR